MGEIELIKAYRFEVNEEKTEVFGQTNKVTGIKCPKCGEVFTNSDLTRLLFEARLHAYFNCNLLNLPRDGGLCSTCKPCIANEEIVEGLTTYGECDEPDIENDVVVWCPFYQKRR